MSTALKKSQENYQIVIGIDFGTSRSGFAYGWMNEQSSRQREISLCTKWPSQPAEIQYVKTPTLLLYTPSEELAWGYAARETLVTLGTQVTNEYHLFEKFKMKLYEGEKYYESNGKKFLVLHLISDYLKKLKEYALQHITAGMAKVLDEKKILWCLTIPAMWGNSAKYLMIDAAVEAGLIQSRSDYGEKLVFVLEPEAAAIYCQYKEVVTPVPSLKENISFMVVDAGGGTVDITVHKVSPKGLHALAKSIGDAHGSTYVDQDFHKHLEKLLTPEVLTKLAKKMPVEYVRLLNKWEQNKCAFSEEQINRDVSTIISIPTSISRKWSDEVFKNIAQYQDGEEENIVLSPRVMEDIFKNTLDRLISTIDREFDDIRRRNEKCDYLFLVGGFSQSPFLQRRIKEKYEGTKVQRVVIPDNAGSAILWGAVSYGIDPSIIRSRSSSLTYGVEVASSFDELQDDESKKFWHPWREEYFCHNRFDIFVHVGQIVEVGKKVVHTFTMGSPDQTLAIVKIYSTLQKYTRYIDDPGVNYEAEIEINIPDTTGGIDRKIEVTMDFSEALITATAKDLTSGGTCQTEIRFSNTYFS